MTTLRLEADRSHDTLSELLPVGLVALSAAIAGALQAQAPLLVPLALGLLFAPIALSLKTEWLVLGAIALALFTRPLVAAGAPEALNFAHFGLALVALLRLIEGRQPRVRGLAFDLGLAGLTVAIVASTIANHALIPRAAFLWLSLAEPFLFVALMMYSPDVSRNLLRGFLLAFAVIQIPIAGLQFLLYGVGDGVQGTLMGQGAGQHIIGAIGVMAGVGLILGSRQGSGSGWMRWPLAVALMSIGILSDAKQVYGALALGAAVFALPLIASVAVLPQSRKAARSLLPLMALVAAMMIVGAHYYPPLANAFDPQMMEDGADAKLQPVRDIGGQLGWSGSVVGLGPGNGLSRVALALAPGYGSVPWDILGDSPSPVTARAVAGYPAGTVSSAASPFASWSGIYSDIGIFGLAMYLLLGAWIWNALGRSSPNDRNLGRLLLLFAGALGLIFTWLEEPAFLLYLAAALGACLKPVAGGSNAQDRHPGLASDTSQPHR